ncbi:MAG TPA: hypothetical protein DEA90_06195 [Opitutae bacterium]|nr:hypothetical protein [Puniceicoccaceae bacterium]HBR93737.1 hypothetical protein [Opitutae bacterium]|tara:strand:- start:15977 stop:16486 length:510 start_codon:yes stop_codon:yes gene_type:complete
MSPAQHKKMQVRYLCVFRDLCEHFELKQTKDYRSQITEWVLGHSNSSNTFSGAEFSRLIDTMQAWIAGDQEPGPLSKSEQNHAAHAENANQLIHAISELADDDYIQAIANDRHNNRPWRTLSAFELGRLRMTIKRAHLRAAKKGKTLKFKKHTEQFQSTLKQPETILNK